QKALDFYNLELKLREKIQPGEMQSALLASIAGIQTELGYYGEAEGLLKQVVKADAEEFGKDSEEYFISARSLIDLYVETERVDEAIKLALDLRKNVNNSEDEYVTYKWVGDSYAVQGSFRKAERNLTKGLEGFEENGLDATFSYVSTLNSLAILYEEMGRLDDSEEVFVEAIAIAERLQGDNEDIIAGIKSNLARVYFNLGDYAKASNLQKESLKISEEYYGENSFNYGLDLLNLGLTKLYANQLTESEGYLLKALPVFEEAGGSKSSIDYGRAESLLSRLYSKKGDIEKAIEYGQDAIRVYNATLGEDYHETAFPNFFLADAYLGYDEIDKAYPLAERAYYIRKKALGKGHPYFARSANQMARINWKKGDNEKALGYYQETFENYFKQINTFFPVLTEEEKATFYYTNLRPAFEQYISFIEETSLENKELLGEIYNYQLSLKGLIMYATSKVRESILNSGDEVLIGKFEEWISQKEQLAKLFSATDMELAVRNKKIDSLTASSNGIEEELSKASQAFGDNFASKSVTWQDIRNTLKPGEAAVEMVRYRDFTTDSAGVFTDEVYYAAMIVRHDTEEHPEMVILRNGAQMEKKFLSNYRNAIKYKISENYSYRLFWE
ncbi:MAG: tetratricopeptide repeat protein, partial [Ekhidna sp.]|nr:tetratricopeptide repeat protein [Ekhidna sp.]